MFVYRNYTVENMFPEGTHFSGYGDITFIPKDEKELIWFYQVPINLDGKKQCEEVDNIRQKFEIICSEIENATLYVLTLENIFPIRSVDSDNSLSEAIAAFNQTARTFASSMPNVRIIDFGEFLSHYPADKWINWRFYFISQMIIAPGVAGDFYPWLSKRIEQINGSRKKCLVLDLDNTLWGGVLGEDGISGIKIGGDYPGNAFLYFQEGLIKLANNGIILSICSKNNETDVLEAWEKNPFIKLKQDNISAYRINWNNKADNIRELSNELNIGLDSMVFVDDNPTERELVRQELPMVAVPDFPKKPYGLLELYQNLVADYFRAYELTNEDREKTAQYKANAKRAAALKSFSDMNSFIKSLDIELDILAADEFNIPRIAQMTQKTNQFNLTTHRYTEADIAKFVEDGASVFCLSVKDKFGDNGITGAIIITKDGQHATIDTLLLSCRILGKDIERAFISTVLDILYDSGITEVSASYIPTAKNGLVAEFYDKAGFTCVSTNEGVKRYTKTINSITCINDNYKIKITIK